jgi:hypothetical protein
MFRQRPNVVVQRLSLAGIEEQALGALLIGNSRPIVGRQSRQHFGLQGGKSRDVRGLTRSLQLSLEILLCDFAVPSSCMPRSIAITLNRSPSPGHLQSAGSRSFRAKDRNAVRITELAPRGRAFGKPDTPKSSGPTSGEARCAAKIYLSSLVSFRNLRRCEREKRLDCRTEQSVLLQNQHVH